MNRITVCFLATLPFLLPSPARAQTENWQLDESEYRADPTTIEVHGSRARLSGGGGLIAFARSESPTDAELAKGSGTYFRKYSWIGTGSPDPGYYLTRDFATVTVNGGANAFSPGTSLAKSKASTNLNGSVNGTATGASYSQSGPSTFLMTYGNNGSTFTIEITISAEAKATCLSRGRLLVQWAVSLMWTHLFRSDDSDNLSKNQSAVSLVRLAQTDFFCTRCLSHILWIF